MAAFAAALVATASLTPVAARLALRWDLLDRPNERSSHVTVTPRIGGVACLVGVAVGTLVGWVMDASLPLVALGAGGLLSLVGLADDRWHLGALARLCAQALVGAGAGWLLGGPAFAALGLLAAVVVVNAVNFMDGVNGLTALTLTVFGAVAFFLGHTAALVMLGALIAGSALGFLPWNAPRARVFLGDSGSYLFGGLAAFTLLVATRETGSPLVFAAPLFGYAVDTGFTLLRRARRGAALLEAHREHTYQVLANEAGLPHLAVAAIVASVGVVATALIHYLPLVAAIPALAVLAAAYLALPAVVRRRTPSSAPPLSPAPHPSPESNSTS